MMLGIFAMKTRNKDRLAARRREVVNLYHKGWTQSAIASHLKIPQATVSRDLAAMRDYWREFSIHDVEKVRIEQLQKIDLIETEAWAAWERSQKQHHSAQITRDKNGDSTRTSLQDRYGDPRFLREVGRCIADRHRIVGVSPPELPPKPSADGDDDDDKVETLYGMADAFRMLLVLIDQFGEPPYHTNLLSREQIEAVIEGYRRDPYIGKTYFDAVARKEAREAKEREAAELAAGGAGGQPASPESTSAKSNSSGDPPDDGFQKSGRGHQPV